MKGSITMTDVNDEHAGEHGGRWHAVLSLTLRRLCAASLISLRGQHQASGNHESFLPNTRSRRDAADGIKSEIHALLNAGCERSRPTGDHEDADADNSDGTRSYACDQGVLTSITDQLWM